jgi:hypothetical protein
VVEFFQIGRADIRDAYYCLDVYQSPIQGSTGGVRRGSSSEKVDGEEERQEKTREEARGEEDIEEACG